MVLIKICGPKYSWCCSILSVWGIIQLALMGGFFYNHSISLNEDIGLSEEFEGNFTTFYEEADHKYQTVAYQCWVAVAVYTATLILSVCQIFVNKRASSSYQA